MNSAASALGVPARGGFASVAGAPGAEQDEKVRHRHHAVTVKVWRTAGVGAPCGQEGQESKLCSHIGLPTVLLGVLAGFRWGARIHQTVALRF